MTFGESDQYDRSKEGNVIPEDSLIEEIKGEMLSSQELINLVSRFSGRHSFTDTALLSCGACGFRDMQSPRVKYCEWSLDGLGVLKYNQLDCDKLNCLIEKGGFTIPVDEERRQKFICPWKFISYYKTINGDFDHLHPVLVDIDSNTGGISTTLCSTCYGKISRGLIPRLSIAAGVDFGNPSRIKELTPLNLHEKMLLATHRLFQVIVKLSPNTGQMNYTRTNIKGNAVLLLHDAPLVVDLLVDNTEDRPLEICLLDECGKIDHLARKVYKSTTVLGRPYVLKQWLKVLQAVNPN